MMIGLQRHTQLFMLEVQGRRSAHHEPEYHGMIPATAAATARAAAIASQSPAARSGFTPCSRAQVVANSVRREKQFVARKELQKRAKQEYLRRIYETADRVEDDHLVFELQPSSPRVRSELQQSAQHAALNKQLAQEIPQLDSWQQVQLFVQQHANNLNFLNVVLLVSQAAALQQAGPDPSTHAAADAAAAATAQQSDTAPAGAPLVAQLAVHVLEHSSWFQPTHFATCSVALASMGVVDVAVWDNLTAAAEHKVGAFTFPQLASMLEALAAAGYTPELSWVERCYRQASKHLHAADPHDIAVLLGAWGEMGYTPRDRLFLNQVKIVTRRAFDQRQLSGTELVQLMHGLARMPRYAPNQGWLAALAKATQRQLKDLTPGAVVDLLLSFVALDHRPPQRWMDAALTQLQDALLAIAAEAQQHPNITSSTSVGIGVGPGSQQLPQQQQQHQLLFLPPYDPQQLLRDQQLQEPGLLISQPGPQQQLQPPVEAAELSELQLLFDEAEGEEREADDSSVTAAEGIAGLQQQQQQQAQQAEAGAPAQPAEQQQGLNGEGLSARVSMSSRASSSHNLSLRWQLLHPGLMPEHLGVLCWCLGRLQFQPTRGWMQLLGEVLLLTVPAVSQEVLVDILVGCVATGYLPVGSLQEQLMVRVLECLPTMPPESLKRTCQALVALEAALVEYEQQPAALAALWQQQGQQGQLTPAAAASISQHLVQHKPQIAAAVVHRQGIVLTGSTTAQLADVLAYVAAAEETPSLDYMSAAVTRAVEKLPDGCPTPAVCRLLWALARMGFKPHPQLLHQLLAALQRGLHLLSSQDLADAGWALCTLRHRPGTSWLALYSKEVAAKAGYMEAQALTDTLWALACFAAQPDREWLKQVLLAVGSKAAAGELSQQNAAVVVWALQQLGFQSQQMAGRVSTQPQPATTGVQSAVLALTGVLQPA